MKGAVIPTVVAVVFAAELAALGAFGLRRDGQLLDPVAVNEAVQTVRQDWNRMGEHENKTELEYVVLNQQGEVVYRTAEGLRETIHEAVRFRDTILDVEIEGAAAGKMLIQNQGERLLSEERQRVAAFFAAAVLIQGGILLGYGIYWRRTVTVPFRRLRRFAERVAEGNLDIPLEMDRKNLFGAFTESFDLMREELKRARLAEAEANAGKKELIAKLSHDIRTPVASIKAAAEVGEALAETDRIRESYAQIIRKADQINTLVTNLFSAALEELSQISVTREELESGELDILLENADYLKRARLPKLPPCLVTGDRLRLQQVFDNVFANSYKYANTEILVSALLRGSWLTIVIEDQGGGVPKEELPLLKEKYRRGSNTEGIEGAGLGLYLANYFMEEMGGSLELANGQRGLAVSVRLPLSGTAAGAAPLG